MARRGSTCRTASAVTRPHGARSIPQHVCVAFLPWGIGDVGDDAVQRAAVSLVAVVEADRVEHVAGKAQVGEQAHGPAGAVAEGVRGVVAHGIGERLRGIAEVVAAAELGQVAPVDRPQPASCEHGLQLIQIQQQLCDRIAEGVRMRVMAPMHHLPDIECAGAHAATSPNAGANRCGSQARSASTTRRALRMPSSWKPQPQ